ncbi:MAG: YlbF family regulator [Clostridia bacterium]|nr:YlbF family regulator [Clostridia bacterium]NDO19126.1 YlbF family regulator [Lachnospiraceae bacterium MD329]
MNEIMEKTRELGELIQNSEEMKNVKNAEILQENDDKAQELLKEFNMQRMNLARDMQNNKISQEEAIKQNNEAFEKMLEESESIKKYIDAKHEFDSLVNQVNQVLNFYITGQDPNCTHNCSTCGGCH